MTASRTRSTRLVAGLFTGLALVSLAACGAETDAPQAPHDGTDTVVVDHPEPPDESGASVSGEVQVRKWEHETSDIPVDARIKFGHLANGMRWAWANNAEPKQRCYVRLHVNIGSLAEDDSELGMAHFLEHMAFNGTENFPAGTLIEWFQEHGMSFGADTNAHTAFGETVYKLDLPKNDPETIREGLRVLRDFASRMDLAEDEVQAEKGVIDGEQRERDSAQFRVMQKELDIVFGGTRIGDRLPIGTKEVRDQFTAASVRAFYERWYRPEQMTLVAVGDFGDLDPVPLFEEAFADMERPDTPLVQEPGAGTANRYSHFYAIHEPEIPTVDLSIARMKAWVEEPHTIAEWTEDMPLDYARRMLNTRFRELAKKESSPFIRASAMRAAILEVFDGENLAITCTPEKWKEALATGEQELRRALEHGFRESELDEIRARALRGLDEAVEREKTTASRMLLGRILNAAENRTVPTDAETRRRIMKPAIEALTVEACHEAFVAAWAEGELGISATGNLDLGADAGDQLRAAYEASAEIPVEASAEVETSAFAYASDPERSGEILSREHVEDLDFDMVRFANGVVLNVKRTDFREKQIMLNVEFGEGMLTADPKDVGTLQIVAGSLMNAGGLEAHSADDLRRLMAGKQVGVGFAIGADRFSLQGGTTAEDLLLECELACASLTAPGWREDGLVLLRRQIPMMFEQMKSTPQGPMQTEFMPALFSGDPRYGLPPLDAIMSCGVDEVKAWLEPVLADAPIEVSLIGDLDVDETIAIVARTFGTLPKRRAWKAFEERRASPTPKPGLQQKHAIETQIPKSLVLIVFPTTDGIEIERRRKLNVLNQVVMDRLRIEVREKLGAAYSPGSMAQSSEVNPGVGMLFMQAMADPDKVDGLVEACLGVADSLSKDGVTDEELDRLREPLLNRRRDGKRQNAFWMQIMARAQSDPAHLDGMRAGDAFYEGVEAADLSPLAKQFLQRDRASILIVNPKPKD